MSEDAEVEKRGREAIEAFVTAVTYPVIWTDGKRIVTLGSGALFQHKDRRFILTARHLFEFDKKTHKEFPFEGLYGPTSLNLRAVTPPRMIGKTRAYLTTGANALYRDIVAIELLDESFINAISKDWQFIGVENVAVPDRDSLYFVGGFPNERERRFGDAVGASCLRLTTFRHPKVPSDVEHYDKRYDLILAYDKQGGDTSRANAPTVTPFAGGVSGGPVLRQADERRMKIWAPKSALSFVGIQSSSTKANQWLRAKNVHAIHRYFDEAIPSIGKAIAKKLGKPR